MPETQAHFEGWAVVELFGHGKAIGFVTTEYYATACLFRVDTPGREEREYTLEKPEWGTDADEITSRLLPIGTKVKRPAAPARSRMVGPASIFALNPCTEEVARRQIERDEPRPLILVELPKNLKAETLLPGERSPFVEGFNDSEEDLADDGENDEDNFEDDTRVPA
jgi:hypothetical protein